MTNITKEPRGAHKKKKKKNPQRRNHWEIHVENTRMYKTHSRNFKTLKIKNEEDTEPNKWTQRGLQQIPKWNKGHY
jgi:hypothetical protein